MSEADESKVKDQSGENRQAPEPTKESTVATKVPVPDKTLGPSRFSEPPGGSGNGFPQC